MYMIRFGAKHSDSIIGASLYHICDDIDDINIEIECFRVSNNTITTENVCIYSKWRILASFCWKFDDLFFANISVVSWRFKYKP